MITKIYNQQEIDRKRAEIISQGIRPMRDTSFTEELYINGKCKITIENENDEIIGYEDSLSMSKCFIDYGRMTEKVNVISWHKNKDTLSTNWTFPNNSTMIIQTDNEILMVLHRKQISDTVIEFNLEALSKGFEDDA